MHPPPNRAVDASQHDQSRPHDEPRGRRPRMRGLNTSTARIGATPPARARVSTTTAQRVVAAAIVPMVAVTVWLAVTSEHFALFALMLTKPTSIRA